jgi:hypothetical protein
MARSPAGHLFTGIHPKQRQPPELSIESPSSSPGESSPCPNWTNPALDSPTHDDDEHWGQTEAFPTIKRDLAQLVESASIPSMQGCWNKGKERESGPGGGWPRRGDSRRHKQPIWGKTQILRLWWLIRDESWCLWFVTTWRSWLGHQFIEALSGNSEFGMRVELISLVRQSTRLAVERTRSPCDKSLSRGCHDHDNAVNQATTCPLLRSRRAPAAIFYRPRGQVGTAVTQLWPSPPPPRSFNHHGYPLFTGTNCGTDVNRGAEVTVSEVYWIWPLIQSLYHCYLLQAVWWLNLQGFVLKSLCDNSLIHLQQSCCPMIQL